MRPAISPQTTPRRAKVGRASTSRSSACSVRSSERYRRQRRFGNVISQGAQQFSEWRMLSFTRDQEYQAEYIGHALHYGGRI